MLTPGTPGRPTFGAVLATGLVAGVVTGAVWWAVELVTNWALGGVVEGSMAALFLALDLALGAAAGLALGALLAVLRRSPSPAALALGMAAAYGLIRIYEPPGFYAEALFVVLAAGAVVLGVRLAGARQGWLAFVQLTLVATVATVVLKAGVSEAQSTYFGHSEPRGVTLPLLLAGLPLVGVLLDRLLGLALRPAALRLGVTAAAGLAVALVWGRPMPTAPLVDAGFAATAPAGAPDIWLISLDTTRADHLSTYGYARETSPNLTALAADALNFTQARSPAQWTVPGHASMLTGMFPSRHGAHYAGGWKAGPEIYGRRRVFPLADEHETLTEILRAHGYATGAFVANFANLYRGFGMAQGFQRYEDRPGLLLRPAPHAVRLVQRFAPSFAKRSFRSAVELNAAALAWMDAAPAARPVFVFLNYLEPHHWLTAPPYDLWTRDLPEADRLVHKGLFTHQIPAGLTENERAFVAGTYDGQLLAMDHAIGQLIADLKARGRYEDALIIVTSDHGELLGEHDQVGHGGRMMYEGLLHVPLVVKFPGAARPRAVVTAPVQLVDIVPSVLEALGLATPPAVQGEPLQRVVRPSLAEEHINPEFVAHYGDVYNRALRVVYDPPYKLITSSRGERLLFDLGRDPSEDTNLASREPERVAAMEAQLADAMHGMGFDTVALGSRP